MRTALALLTAGLLASTGWAQVTTFVGSDPGAGSADPRPNADAAAAAFDSAAGALGAIRRVDFENLPPGQFSSLVVAPGVTATQTGVTPPAGLGGIVTEGFATPHGAPTGYNTTSGGAQFLGFVPQASVLTARVSFGFDVPVQAWGGYLIGLEDGVDGELYVEFNDGSSRSYALPPVDPAGAQFFGFTDPGASITDVALVLKNLGSTRDIYGLDDMAIPEPAALALLGLGAVGLLRRTPQRGRRGGRRAHAQARGLGG